MTTNINSAAQLLHNKGCGSGDTAYYLAHRAMSDDPRLVLRWGWEA